MKKLVFTILDDVCAENKKDINAIDLLKVMNTYGKVEDFDTVLTAERVQYQEVIDNLSAQIQKVADQNLSEDEICMVNAYRTCKENHDKELKAVIYTKEQELTKVKAASETFVKQLASVIENREK